MPVAATAAGGRPAHGAGGRGGRPRPSRSLAKVAGHRRLDVVLAGLARRRLLVLAVTMACIPLLVTALKAGTGHYVPTGDNAVIATRASDVFTSNSPSLGMTSSLSGFTDNADANHPGPLLFWVFSVPYLLSGRSTVGYLLAVLLLQVASVVAIAVVANRRAGPVLATLAMLGVTLIEWSLGGPNLAQPLNPFVTVLPFLAFLLVCWTAACGDGWALPVAVAVGSLCVQAHLSYGVVVLAVGAVAVVGYSVTALPEARRHRDEHRDGPDRQGRSADRRAGWRRHRPVVIATVITTLACWGAPLAQQLTSSHPNLSAIVTGLGPGSTADRMSPTLRHRFFWTAFGLRPTWADPQGWAKPAVALTVLTGGLLMVGLVGLTAWALRTGRASLSWLLVVADVSVAAAYLTLRSAPDTVDPQSFRYLWAIGPFAWAVGLAGLVTIAGPLLQRARVGRRSVTQPLTAAVLVVALSAAVQSDPFDRRSHSAAAAASRIVSTLTAQLRGRLRSGQTYGLVRNGAVSLLSVGPGLVPNLEQHGISIHLLDHDEAAYGTERSSSRDLAGTLLVVSGDANAKAPPGGREVARVVADDGGRRSLEREILRELAAARRVHETKRGQQFFRLLFSLIDKRPALAREFSRTLGQDLTPASLQRILADPAALVRSGAARTLLGSGVLYFLVSEHLVDEPARLLPLIERFEPLRTDADATTIVYLVPPGQSVT